LDSSKKKRRWSWKTVHEFLKVSAWVVVWELVFMIWVFLMAKGRL
jgi:hypothetical protein